MRAIGVLLLVSLLPGGAPCPRQEALPSGSEALSRMRAVYSSCSTYADECTFAVSVVTSSAPPPLWSHGTVSIKFVRGQALRAAVSFGVAEMPLQPAYVLHSSTGEHRLARYSSGQAEPHVWESDSLEYVVGATTGSTGLMAAPVQYVASLLMAGEFSQLGCAQLVHPVVDAIEPVGDSLCLRIHAEGSAGTVFTLWVDRESWLLRRLSRADPVADLRRLTTIEIRGAINAPVAPSELAFP